MSMVAPGLGGGAIVVPEMIPGREVGTPSDISHTVGSMSVPSTTGAGTGGMTCPDTEGMQHRLGATFSPSTSCGGRGGSPGAISGAVDIKSKPSTRRTGGGGTCGICGRLALVSISVPMRAGAVAGILRSALGMTSDASPIGEEGSPGVSSG